MIFPKKAIIAAALVAALPSLAQTRQTREEYVDRYKHIAVAHMERYGIPASITMAQGILESDCGNSWLSRASNNHFGIKCKRNWTGETIRYDDDEKGECFRCYPSVEASYRDHAEFLDGQPRYDSLFAYGPTDYRRWARGLKAAGYATAPDYAERLIRIIEESKLFLLDRENGLALYAAGTGRRADEWFAAESSVERAACSGTAIDPDDYSVSIGSRKGYNIRSTNGVHYIVARDGERFEGIARDLRISARNLRRFNEVAASAQPVAGETVYLGRKKRRWEGETTLHTVGEGETLWSLAQSYGVRSRSLRRMNRLAAGEELRPGATLRIR